MKQIQGGGRKDGGCSPEAHRSGPVSGWQACVHARVCLCVRACVRAPVVNNSQSQRPSLDADVSVWIQNSLTSHLGFATLACVTPGKSFHFSGPQFPHLRNGDNHSPMPLGLTEAMRMQLPAVPGTQQLLSTHTPRQRAFLRRVASGRFQAAVCPHADAGLTPPALRAPRRRTSLPTSQDKAPRVCAVPTSRAADQPPPTPPPSLE